MSTMARWGLRLGCAGFAVVALVVLGAFALRDAIATRVVGGVLAEHGATCTPLGIDVPWDFSSVHVAPTTCAISGGHVATLGLPLGVDVTLEGLRPREVALAELDLGLRAMELPEGAAEGMLDTRVPTPLEKALSGMASIAERRDVPSLRLGLVRVRSDGPAVAIRDVTLSHDASGLVLGIGQIGTPPMTRGMLELGGRLLAIRGTATRSTATVRGRLAIDVDVGPFAVDKSFGFRLEGRGLDTADPSYAIAFEHDPSLDRLRAAIAALRERHDARRDARSERVDALREQRAERRDGVREDLAERREARGVR